MSTRHFVSPCTLAALTAACVVGLTTLALAQSPASTDQFELAIVRHDGALVPFAAFDRGTWTKAWPDANEAVAQIYDSLDAVPNVWRARGVAVPDQWRVWPLRARPPFDARVTGFASVRAHCVEKVPALASTVVNQRIEEVAPVRLQAIAVHGAAEVHPIVSVDRQSAPWARARRVVLAAFDRLEREETGRQPSVPAIKEQPPPAARLLSLHRAQALPSSALFFTAKKAYRLARYPSAHRCPGETWLTGWLLPAANGALRLASPSVYLTTCDETSLATLNPLGSITMPDRTFWIARALYYEGEEYVVFSIGREGVTRLIAAYGGGC